MLGLWVATEVALFNVPLAVHLAEFVVIDSGLKDFWHRIDAAGEADDERSHRRRLAVAPREAARRRSNGAAAPRRTRAGYLAMIVASSWLRYFLNASGCSDMGKWPMPS